MLDSIHLLLGVRLRGRGHLLLILVALAARSGLCKVESMVDVEGDRLGLQLALLETLERGLQLEGLLRLPRWGFGTPCP